MIFFPRFKLKHINICVKAPNELKKPSRYFNLPNDLVNLFALFVSVFCFVFVFGYLVSLWLFLKILFCNRSVKVFIKMMQRIVVVVFSHDFYDNIVSLFVVVVSTFY